jgi:diguanylate cyclase (GGDEF)-like protein
MEQSQRVASQAGLPVGRWPGLSARWVWLTLLASLAVALLFSAIQLALQGSPAPLGGSAAGASWAGLLLANGLKALCSAGVVLFILHSQVFGRLRGVVTDIRRMAEQLFPESQRWSGWNEGARDDVDRVSQVAQHTCTQVRSLVGQLQAANGHLREQLTEQRNHLRTVSLLEEVVVELDPQLGITQVADGWARVLPGLAQLAGKNMRCLMVRDEDLARLRDIVHSFEQGEERSQSLRFLFSGEAQRLRWIEFRVLPRLSDTGGVLGYMGVLQDVTQRQDFEVMIAQLTLHDPLTGLPNRALLEDRLRLGLKACRSGPHRLAVLSLDIDNFKSLNDALGHKTGDRLLMALGKRLQKAASGDETVARWGGDEFSLVWPHISSTSELAARVDALQQRLRRDYGVLGENVTLTTSLGVALFPDDGDTAEELLMAADRAKSAAKAQGRNQVVWAEELRGQHAQRQTARLRQRLMKAVDRGDIQAWYQPIVRSGSHACDMVEVLARWHDEELGWVSPHTFIPLAEASGLISAIGQSVWEQAVRQQVAWRARGWQVRAAVNVSSRQLYRQDFTEQLLASLQRHGLPADAFVLEITESAALQDVTGAPERLQSLRRAGFGLALDDFGTGYASLSQLHDMPLNELKIDISFVRRLDTEVGASMIATIVKLADVLGLQTIAEGVETPEAAERLEQLGVTRLQGYCFGRPMNGEAMAAWLAREPQAEVA